MKLLQFPYEIAAASHSADALQQQCRGAVTNWPGAVLMLPHYRSKSLWEHITIMFLAMSQIPELFFFPILERHSVSQRAYRFFCVCFLSHEPETKTQFLGSQIKTLGSFFLAFLYSFFLFI